jgi:hypothetical protein
VVEESQIKRGANRELLILWEHNVAAIVALFDGFENIRRVIRPIATRLNDACLCPSRRRRECFARVMRRDWVIRSLR